MPRPRATAAQRNEQRQRIRQAASEIYDSKGASAVSVRAVAERAGTSQGTIYSYFSSLADLMRSLWTVPVERANRQLEQVAADTSDPVERIRVLLEEFVRFVLSRPDVHRGALLFVRPVSHAAPEQFPLDKVPLFRLLAEAITEAHAQGRIVSEDPHRTAELLWAAVHGALGLPFNADIYELSPSSELAEGMIELVLGAIIIEP